MNFSTVWTTCLYILIAFIALFVSDDILALEIGGLFFETPSICSNKQHNTFQSIPYRGRHKCAYRNPARVIRNMCIEGLRRVTWQHCTSNRSIMQRTAKKQTKIPTWENSLSWILSMVHSCSTWWCSLTVIRELRSKRHDVPRIEKL